MLFALYLHPFSTTVKHQFAKNSLVKKDTNLAHQKMTRTCLENYQRSQKYVGKTKQVSKMFYQIRHNNYVQSSKQIPKYRG